MCLHQMFVTNAMVQKKKKKRPPGRDVISRTTRLVCRKWDVYRCFILRVEGGKGADGRRCRTRGGPVPRDEATSAALLGEQHVVESGPMYFLERRYPKKRCK